MDPSRKAMLMQKYSRKNEKKPLGPPSGAQIDVAKYAEFAKEIRQEELDKNKKSGKRFEDGTKTSESHEIEES